MPFILTVKGEKHATKAISIERESKDNLPSNGQSGTEEIIKAVDNLHKKSYR